MAVNGIILFAGMRGIAKSLCELVLSEIEGRVGVEIESKIPYIL